MSKKPSNPRNWNPATLGIHGLDRVHQAHFAVSTPIVHTSNYYFNTTQEVYDFMKAKSEGKVIREHEYGRYGNPTQTECERKLAAIEGAERAVLFSTGMSAVILTIMTFMSRDGHIIFTSDCYRQTRDFASNLLAEFGIKVSLVDPTAEAIEKAIKPNTNIIFTESPTNPYLRCLDISSGREGREEAQGPDHHRRHTGHAVQHQAAGYGRRCRDPFSHQVSGRSQRPPGRRRPRLG